MGEMGEFFKAITGQRGSDEEAPRDMHQEEIDRRAGTEVRTDHMNPVAAHEVSDSFKSAVKPY